MATRKAEVTRINCLPCELAGETDRPACSQQISPHTSTTKERRWPSAGGGLDLLIGRVQTGVREVIGVESLVGRQLSAGRGEGRGTTGQLSGAWALEPDCLGVILLH